MTVIAEIFDSLENKIEKLIASHARLEHLNVELKTELSNKNAIILNQSREIDSLKKEYEAIKIANSLLGSEENKRDTKLKINSLIREIDYCIAQLSS